MSWLWRNLPNELVLEIVDHLLSDVEASLQQDADEDVIVSTEAAALDQIDSEPADAIEAPKMISSWELMSTLVALASTCSSANEAISPRIYKFAAKKFPALLFWACDRGHSRLVGRLLIAGANPNCALFNGTSLPEVDFMAGTVGQRPTAAFQLFDRKQQYSLENVYMGRKRYYGLIHRPYGCWNIADEEALERVKYARSFPLNASEKSTLAFPIHLAARGGHHDTLKMLLAHGASAKVPSLGLFERQHLLNKQRARRRHHLCWTPIHFAIESQDLQSIQTLIDAYPEGVFTERDYQISVFHSAAAVGNDAIIDLLLQSLQKSVANGGSSLVDPVFAASPLQFPDHCELSPIVFAHMFDNFATMEYLVRLGADVDGNSVIRYTPLIAACALGQAEVARTLIDLGADPNVVCREDPNESAMQLTSLRPIDACCQTDHPENASLVAKLFAAGATLNPPTRIPKPIRHRGYSGYPIIAAAATHQLEVLRVLLKHGADPDILVENSFALRPLLAAVSFVPDPSTQRSVFEAQRDSASPEADNNRGAHPIDVRSQAPAGLDLQERRMLECVSLLLDHGANARHQDRHGNNCFDVLCMFLSGSGPDLETYNGMPPGCLYGQTSGTAVLEIAKLLLKAGADGRLQNPRYNHKTSFLQFAYYHESFEFCKTIIEHGARLRTEPDELKDCFDQMLRDIRIRAQLHGAEYTTLSMMRGDDGSWEKAMEIIVAMDTQNRIGREPYFLAEALSAGHAPYAICSSILDIAKKDHASLGAFMTSRHHSKLDMPSWALMSGCPRRVDLIFNLMKTLDPSWITTRTNLGFLLDSFGEDEMPRAKLLLDHGAPVHWLLGEDSEGGGSSVLAELEACTALQLRDLDIDPVLGPVAQGIQQNSFTKLEVLLTYKPLSDRVPSRYHAAYLKEAARWTHVHMLVFLLAWGANPDAVDPSTGDTALLYTLRRILVATEEDVSYEWRRSLTLEVDDNGSRHRDTDWIRNWVACVSILFKQKGAVLHKDISGVTATDYMLKILEYSGSDFFRICLREEAKRNWKIAAYDSKDGSSKRSVQLIDAEGCDSHTRLNDLEGLDEQDDFERLMELRQAHQRQGPD